MRIKKSILLFFSIILSIIILNIIPFESVKAVTEYDVWVNGERFTSEHMVIQCGEGTATFDGDCGILLENATMTQSYEYAPWYEAVIYSAIPNLLIQVIGDSSIIPSSQWADGIDAAGGCEITLAGNEKLDIKNAYYGMYIGSYEQEGGDLSLTGNLTLNIENTSAAGIWVNRNIDIENCTVTINRESSNYNGIVSNIDGTIRIADSDVTINNVQSAIHMGNSDESNHVLNIISGIVRLNSSEAYGIKVEPVGSADDGEIKGEINISGGRLEITSSLGGTNVPTEKISFANGIGYTTGSDITQAGSIVISEVEAQIIKGDMNKDNYVNSTDAALVLDKYKNNDATEEDAKIK